MVLSFSGTQRASFARSKDSGPVYDVRSELRLIESGTLTQNAYVQSCNGKFRDECPRRFLSVSEGPATASTSQMDYEQQLAHRAPIYVTAAECAADLPIRDCRDRTVPSRGSTLTLQARLGDLYA